MRDASAQEASAHEASASETSAHDASAREAAGVAAPAGDPLASLVEARLFTRATEGDRVALDAVWRANRGWLAGVVAAHAPRGADIEDLLQEVAATFVAKSREVRDALSLRGWLRTVAVNAARIASRSQRIERRSLARVADGSPGAFDDRPDAILAEAREAEELLALLREIPALYAEPLLLQAARGLTQRAIAELLGVPETTVETRLARGRRLLRAVAAERERASGQVEWRREPRSRGDEAQRSMP